jgi:hypothetical protein
MRLDAAISWRLALRFISATPQHQFILKLYAFAGRVGDSASMNALIIKQEISMFYSNQILLALYLVVVSLIVTIIMLSVISIPV